MNEHIALIHQIHLPESDPTVIAALEELRVPEDIWVIYCGECGFWSYWNEGSHANCRNCEVCLDSDEAITLADYWTDATYPCDMEQT